MEAIIAAAITAIASIIVALIQANSAQKQAKLLRGETIRKEPPTGGKYSRKAPDMEAFPINKRFWWWVGAIVVVIAGNIFIRGFIDWDESDYIIFLGIIPLSTCFLAYFRPIRWGYVAAFVTLLAGISILGEYLDGGWYEGSDIPFFALIFIGNSFVAAGIAFLRQRKLKTVRSS
jgi:hypothetical protein